MELMLVVPPGGPNWNQWCILLEFYFLLNFYKYLQQQKVTTQLPQQLFPRGEKLNVTNH